MLTTDQILTHTVMPEKILDVPEWGGQVTIRAINKAKAQEMREAATTTTIENGKQVEKLDGNKMELAMFAAGVVDPPFAQDQLAQIALLANGPVTRITQEILKISGMSVDGQTSQEAVDERQKSAASGAVEG